MRLVIALGGNALGNNPKEQQALLKDAIEKIIPLIKEGHEIILAHGNGPQVGMINLAFTYSNDKGIPLMPLPECTAMSQGYIGFHIEAILRETLKKHGMEKKVASLITQVEVDENDASFSNPTKPVGPFYTKEEALTLQDETGDTYVEDAGRGYRRVVASPKPVAILEIETIKDLLETGHIVIAGGGGGIPVFSHDMCKVASGVIDKDLASELIAENVNADRYFILTNVKQVELNYNQPNAKKLHDIDIEEATTYINEGHFAPGSMLPKVEAAIKFAKNTGNKAVITSLENIENAVKGIDATLIHR